MKTKREFVEEMKDVFIQIQALDDQLKEIKTKAKEQDFDAPMLAKIAKALAESKISELTEKTEILLETIEEVQ